MIPNPDLLLYPDDYPAAVSQSAESASFALENAVTLLQRQARDTAIRQALNRHVSGQADAALQNRACKAFHKLMPLNRVGSKQVPVAAILGAIAYLGGGRSHGGEIVKAIASFSFPNETVIPTGYFLSESRTYMGTCGNASSGLFCGGASLKGVSGVIDEIAYRQLSMRRLGMTLTIPIFSQAGVGDGAIGILLGGISASGVPGRHGERITYGNEPTTASLGNVLATGRGAPHNGTSNPAAGFIYGGYPDSFVGGVPLKSIESFNFSTQTISPVGASLIKSHVVHAAVGSAIKGYLLGGADNPAVNIFGADISAFTYSGQTLAVLGITLPEAKICPDGIGSSIAGYAVGGDTAASNWQGTTSIFKLNYASETGSTIGAALSDSTADQGGFGDYGAGFSV